MCAPMHTRVIIDRLEGKPVARVVYLRVSTSSCQGWYLAVVASRNQYVPGASPIWKARDGRLPYYVVCIAQPAVNSPATTRSLWLCSPSDVHSSV